MLERASASSHVAAAAVSAIVVLSALVWAVVRLVSTAGGGYGDIFGILGVLAIVGVVGTAGLLVGVLRGRNGSLALLGVAGGTALVLLALGLAAGLRG